MPDFGNRELVIRALAHARAVYLVKSANKLHVRDPAKRARRLVARQMIIRLRRDVHAGRLSDLDAYVDRIETETAGNCGEMAVVAWRFMSDRLNVHGLGVMEIRPPGDHAFAVVGMAQGAENRPMAQWGPNCFVCDPWANIACAASDYPFAWKQKMRKWHTDQKLILDAANNRWMDPTFFPWFTQMEVCRRRVMYYVP